MAEAAKVESKPKKLEKGTPEGDKLVRVRCKRDVDYGTSPALIRRYKGPCQDFPDGEELVIPMWRFTDYHTPVVINTKNGETMSFRGSFELADRPKPIDTNVAQHSENMQEVIAQNEELRRRLAIVEGRMPDEVVVIPEYPESPAVKNKRRQEI